MRPWAPFLILSIIVAGSAFAMEPPSQPTAITVPAGNGAPVITDGIFDPGEWDDALRIPINPSVALYLKEFRGIVFIGIRGEVGPSELLLAAPGGPIQKMHVSAQLYEVVLPAEGPEPRPRFGLSTRWYANELRRDVEISERMQKEGKSPMEVIRASSYPSDGIEFAIRRAKLPAQRWMMRLWVTGFIEGKPASIIYPRDTAERSTAGWVELQLNSESAQGR